MNLFIQTHNYSCYYVLLSRIISQFQFCCKYADIPKNALHFRTLPFNFYQLLMYFNGLTINIMTLGGLALGAGMLIDNAIVVMENIFRNLENGLSPKEAAIKGASEVSGAITSSTLTTIVVFLPIV